MDISKENLTFFEDTYELVGEFFRTSSISVDEESVKKFLTSLCSKKVLDHSDINKWSGAIVNAIVINNGFPLKESVIADFFVMTSRDLIEFGNLLKSLMGGDMSLSTFESQNVKAPVILPIGSGKGGVGKSLIAASLAISFAKKGHRTIIIDLDLGGSNLHNYLNQPNRFPGIGDYLKGGRLSFTDIIQQTSIQNLSFVAGDGKTPFMANIPYQQRMKLIREIKRLDYDYIILDIGAGSSFNTLSYFNLSPKGVIVTGSESASVMNFLTFLKNLLFKVITSTIKNKPHITSVIKEIFKQPIDSNPVYVSTLLNRISAMDRSVADKLKKHLSKYRPRIIFNMIDDPNEMNILTSLDKSLRKNLSLQCDFIGIVKFDNSVRKIVKSKQPIVMNNSGQFQSNIEKISSRIERVWDKPLKDSHIKLIAEAKKM